MSMPPGEENYGLSPIEASWAHVPEKQRPDGWYLADFGTWQAKMGRDLAPPTGGSGSVDHFWDVSPTDQFGMDRATANDAYQQKKDEADAAYRQKKDEADAAIVKLNNERDWALKMGDYELAKQKEADLNYWNGVSADIEMRGQDLTDINSQRDYAVGMANVEVARSESNNKLQIGMANATNDADRNQIQATWNAEQAAIAKMEDETKRLLGTQANQTGQFSAETSRAVGMGNLALENNKFIAEMARSPRDLFGLYFMQRGIAPDWDGLQAGNVTHGSALAPSDVMGAYKPTTGSPTFSMNNASAGAVGKATSYRPGANPYINMNGASSGGGGGGGAAPAGNSFTSSLPRPNTSGPPAPGPSYMDINPGGKYGGTPDALMRPGMNLSTVGEGAKGSSFFQPGMAGYYDVGKTKPIGMEDDIAGGTQVWIDYNPTPKMAFGGFTDAPQFIVGDHPSGRPTGNEEKVTLDIQNGQPVARVDPLNPPQRPVTNQNSFGGGVAGMQQQAQQMQSDWGRPAGQGFSQMAAPFRNQGGSRWAGHPQADRLAAMGNAWGRRMGRREDEGGDDDDMDFQRQEQQGGGWQRPAPRSPWQAPVRQPSQGGGPQYNAYGILQTPSPNQAAGFMSPQEAEAKANWQPKPQQYDFGGMGNDRYYNDGGSMARQEEAWMRAGGYEAYQAQQAARQQEWQQQQAYERQMRQAQQNPYNPNQWSYDKQMYAQNGMPRFAVGTDPYAAAYQNSGMGGLYQQSSGNQHLAGQPLPPKMQMLADWGMPITPSLAANATGGIAPSLNMGAAVTQGRGAGVTPSLQTLARQTKGETEHTRGYYEGVAGVPWADLVDFIGKPTSNLQRAQTARAA